MGKPVRQGHGLAQAGVEDFQENQVGVAHVLDIVAVAAVDAADVAGIEVGGHRFWPGVEHRHLCCALDVVLPLVGGQVPVQLARAARVQALPKVAAAALAAKPAAPMAAPVPIILRREYCMAMTLGVELCTKG